MIEIIKLKFTKVHRISQHHDDIFKMLIIILSVIGALFGCRSVMEVTKSDIDKPFKLNGLFLSPEANHYLLAIIQRVEPSKRQKVLRRLVETILKQKIDSNRITKDLCESAVNECKAERNTATSVFFVVDAFSVPYFKYSKLLKKFVPYEASDYSEKRFLFPLSAQAKAFVYSYRYEIIYQRMLRHQVFSQTASLSGSKPFNYRLRPIEYLLASGSRIDSVVILGMVSQLREGEWHAEDPTGVVQLNIQQAIFHEGLFPEGSVLLIEGFYDEKVLYVTAIGLPPCEISDVSRRAFSVSNPFGGGPSGALAAPQDPKMHHLLTTTQAGADAMLVLLGETQLDRPGCLDKLATMFSGYTSCPPVGFIMTGNFLSSDSSGKSCAERRITLRRLMRQLISNFQANFSETGTQESSIVRCPHLVLIPGPDDPVCAPAHILPRPGLSTDLVMEDAKQECPSWLHLASNPCRLRLYTREIVVFRIDYTNLLVRHCIHLPTSVSLDSENSQVGSKHPDNETIDELPMSKNQSFDSTNENPDEKQHSPFEYLGQGLARCLASQAHLLPVLGHIAPVYWLYDQALSLHPLPNLVVAVEPEPLANLNASEPGLVTTGNCRFINPGRFGQIKSSTIANQNSFTFKVYYPRTGVIEDSCLPD